MIALLYILGGFTMLVLLLIADRKLDPKNDGPMVQSVLTLTVPALAWPVIAIGLVAVAIYAVAASAFRRGAA